VPIIRIESANLQKFAKKLRNSPNKMASRNTKLNMLAHTDLQNHQQEYNAQFQIFRFDFIDVDQFNTNLL